jgi:preprotein translocase subunit SecG
MFVKKTIIIFCIIFFTILLVVCVSLTQNSENLATIKKENAVYEEYIDKTVFGTEVMTIINKAMNTNEKNNVEKDEDGFYINNNINSIQVELKLLSDSKLYTYQMETIQKVGKEGFIKNFNLILFKCTNIEYHESTKRVSKITFEQIEE